MQISQLYHLISEVERESRQRANEKFRPSFKKLEREKSKIAIQLAVAIGYCENSDGEINISPYQNHIQSLYAQFHNLGLQGHELCKKVGDEAERVAQMLLEKKGIYISVKDNRIEEESFRPEGRKWKSEKKILPNSDVLQEYDYTQADADDLELEIADMKKHSKIDDSEQYDDFQQVMNPTGKYS